MRKYMSYFKLSVKCILFLFAVLCSAGLFAQTDAIPVAVTGEKPRFGEKEGMVDFTEWVYSKFEYPKEYKEFRINDRVILSFIVAKDGSVNNVRVLRGNFPLLNEEVKRVVLQSPKWKYPGKRDGVPVNVRVTFPFIINSNGTKSLSNVIENKGKTSEYWINSPQLTKKPEFNGMEANQFQKWVYENLSYPQECIEESVSGRVIVTFVIDEKGKVTEPKVISVNTTNECLGKEALKVVSQSPDWTPGEVDGKPVRVSNTIPIIFQTVKARKEKVENISTISSSRERMIPPKFTIGTASPTYTPGSYNNFTNWVFENLKYPDIAKKEGYQGRVYVSFVVNEKGEVEDVRIINGAHESLNKEAIRVIKSSPDWVPARIGDINVPVTYTFPVIFQLR